MPPLSVWIALSAALLHAVANTTVRSGLRTASPITASLVLVWIQWIVFGLLLVPAGGFGRIDGVGLLLFCAAGLTSPLLFMIFFFIGIQRIGAARATTIKSAAPIYTVIFAVAFLGERPDALRYLGIAAVMAGVLSLVWETADKKGHAGRRSDYLFPLLAGACAGVSAVLYKAGLTRMDTPLLSVWIGATEAVLLFPLLVRVFPKADRYRIGSRRAWLWLALGGLASSGAIYCQILSIKLGEVSTVFTLAQTSPLFVVLISALFLRDLERVTPRVVLGAALTVGGGIMLSAF